VGKGVGKVREEIPQSDRGRFTGRELRGDHRIFRAIKIAGGLRVAGRKKRVGVGCP
jgi:hypothetical protein